MLPRVSIHRFSCASFTNIENYRRIVGDETIEEILELARDLRGVRLCHINSTGYGGGVAELLSRHVPLSRALGIDADWRLLQGTAKFFTVTKAFHNALQGAAHELTESEKAIYLHINRESAKLLDKSYDVFVVHDPQPAALREAVGASDSKWIWRCHIDTSAPNVETAEFLLPYLRCYDAIVFTMKEFLLPGLEDRPATFIAPAIDPLSTKNMDLSRDVCREIVANAGIDLTRPLVVQVSRFDPWKDPMGVIDAYHRARRDIPGLQLALVGAIAGDDPEGWQLLSLVEEMAASEEDLYVFTNLAGVGNLEVNAFQRACDLVIQKSIREGFGLVVSEAFWKGKPVIAGRSGGIPMQYPAGFDRYLINGVDECAARMVELLRDPHRGRMFAEAAHEHVRRGFLLPRLLRDELRMVKGVLAGRH